MCGIAGFIGPDIPEVLPRMLDSIRHRGPDDTGEYHDASVQLGMVRLSIIDLSGGHQPIANEDNTVWAIFNGEIFNYIELRKDLEDKGHQFRTSSDTETIVHAYEEYGSCFTHKLNGMFTIALWDTHTRTLRVYRDRFGVKPLFYSIRSKFFAFGSEIKSLLQHPSITRELDSGALSHYLALRNIPAPFTIYRDIRALLPGEMITWSEANGAVVSRWYTLPTEVRFTEDD